MLIIAATDAVLINRAKRYSFIAWLTGLILGLLFWGAKSLDLDEVAFTFLLGAWIAAIAFLICWLFLVVSVLISLFNHFSRHNDRA